MDDNVNQAVSSEANEFVPAGFTGNEDACDPSTWGSAQTPEAGSLEELFAAATTSDAGPTTTVAPAEVAVPPEQASADQPGVQGQNAQDDSLRFTIDFNHAQQEVVLDRADLASVYQKSLVTEKYQKKLAEAENLLAKAESLARLMKYENADDMLTKAEANHRQSEIDRLTERGWDQADAEAFYDMQRQRSSAAPASTPASASKPESTPAPQLPVVGDNNRDFTAEVEQLMIIRPSLRNSGMALPAEVQAEVAGGKNLAQAYLEYEARQSLAKAEQLAKENAILKQNAASSAQAPVRGVAGGGAIDSTPSDPFLDGMKSVWNRY